MSNRTNGSVVATLFCAVVSIAASTSEAQVLMMPDSTNNRLATFDANTGALINSNLFALAGGTPIHAMQVGQEIWVSEQIGDRISRWSMAGASLGAITGGMDNVRGMEQVDNTVFLANSGTGNAAPGRSLIMFTPAGANSGFFATAATSSFGVLSHNGDLLVSSDTANDDIHVYSTTGADKGTFHNSTSLNFGEQMDHALNGDVLVAAFSSNIIARLDPTTGGIISTFAASGARGVKQLGNGNIMWTSGAGAFVFDVTTQQSTQVYTGGGRFIDSLNVPEPATGMLLAGSIALFARRARRR